jgi:signal transduction histidine kinase
MFLRSLSRMRKSVSFRITIWYSILFPLSSLLVFGLIYFRLSSYVNLKNQEILEARAREYASQYEARGIQALRDEISRDRRVDKSSSFFVRIAGPENNTLFLSVPKSDTAFDYKYLEQHNVHARWIDFVTGVGAYATEVRSTHLSDGSLLQVGKSVKHREMLIERFREIFAEVTIPVILLGFVGGVFLSSRSLKPIRNLIDIVRYIIDTGKMHARVPENLTGDELEELIVLFNKMLERIETLINGMKGSLDNVAHDLRTPITRLRGAVEVALQSDEGADALRESLMDCAEESERILTMVNTLMDISEAEAGVMRLQVEEVNLCALLDDVVELYDYVAEERSIAVCTECPADLCVQVDPNRMRQVLANLLDNAIKFNPRGGRVTITAHHNGGEVVINVEDTGEGIPAEEIPKIWDRLYTVDKSRSHRGLGLGLSLVRAIIHAHGGSVEVLSEPGKGSHFTLHLPAAMPAH